MPANKYHRATIRRPEDFTPGSFRTIRLPEGGNLPARVVIGKLKGATATTTQALLFPATWTRRSVETWINEAGRQAIAIAWANPESDRDRLRSAVQRARTAGRAALAALLAGRTGEAEQEIRGATAAANSAALLLRSMTRQNPDHVEAHTAPQTHIREALAHLVQADRDTGRGNLEASIEALEAAQEHIDNALERLEAPANAANPCTPERNAAAPAAWNPGTIDNPYKPDRWALEAYRQQARKRGLHAVTWTHPKAGPIFTHSPAKGEKFAAFKKREAARIKTVGGRVVKWYPLRGSSSRTSSRKNPPPPRQLVQLGDVLELHMKDGKGYRWRKGEAALLTQPGTEKESRGKARLVLAPLRSAKRAPGKGPHKTSERTFETWHGKLPTAARSRVADIPGLDEFTKALGQVKAIVYSSSKWQERSASYVHDFEAPFPRLYAGPRGTYEVRGGGFRVTARGIVG